MADDQIDQNEIELLLQQAGAGEDNPPATGGAETAQTEETAQAAGTGPVQQGEIDDLLSALGDSSSSSSQQTAGSAGADVGTVTAAPPLAEASQPTAGSSGTADDIQFLLDQAEQAIGSINQPSVAAEGLVDFQFRNLDGAAPSDEKATLDLLRDVELDLKIELGRTHMYLEEVLKLRRGSVVALDKLAGDPVDVYVNGRLIARGEVLVLNDNFCVRVAELISGDDQ